MHSKPLMQEAGAKAMRFIQAANAGAWLLAATLFSPAAGAASGPGRWELSVRLDAEGRMLTVSGCSRDALAGVRLRAHGDSAPHLRSLQRGEASIDTGGRNGVWLADWQPGECYRARVDLASAAGVDRFGLGGAPGEWWRIPPQLWLWRPVQLDPESTIAFELPEGWSASVPWTPLPDGSGRRRMGATPDDWPAQTAFGRFQERTLELPGGRMRVSMLPLAGASEQRKIQDWFDATAPVLLAGDGRLPLPDTQVLIVPLPGVAEPVPWGQVSRGGGAAVMLVVGAAADARTLREDWTAAHELAHLQHPFLGQSGRWLAEGLASYHQNVRRARMGWLTAEQAWAKLDAGFGRGRARGAGAPLGRIGLGRETTMRVYWSGAAYWLESDLALRAAGSSLDAVLAEFRRRHLPSERHWRPGEYIAELDCLVPEAGMLDRYRRYVDDTSFPDLQATLAMLGRPTIALAPGAAESRASAAVMHREPTLARVPASKTANCRS